MLKSFKEDVEGNFVCEKQLHPFSARLNTPLLFSSSLHVLSQRPVAAVQLPSLSVSLCSEAVRRQRYREMSFTLSFNILLFKNS